MLISTWVTSVIQLIYPLNLSSQSYPDNIEKIAIDHSIKINPNAKN